MLVWKAFGDGAVEMAMGWRGYYQLEIGGRVKFLRHEEGVLHETDLGECTHANLAECKRLCEEHHRHAILTKFGE